MTQETGVQTAIQCIYRDLEYARSIIKRRGDKNAAQDYEDEDTEESWAFVGRDEPDPDAVTTKLSAGLEAPGGSDAPGKAPSSQPVKAMG